MKRTNPLVLVGLTPFGFALGFLVDWAFVTRGFGAIQIPWSLAITTVVLGIVVVVLGSRVRWATVPKPGRRIDPILAVQILTLAKASSVTGALLTGAVGGVLAFTLTRPVVSTNLVPSAIAGVVASIVLTVCAIIAERLCRIPPPSDPEGEPA